jgi:ATP-dependent Lon protease
LYPVVPLRDLVVFPHTIVPLHIGRKKSVNALAVEDVAGGRKPILLVTQKNNDTDPSPEAIYRMGTLATIMQWDEVRRRIGQSAVGMQGAREDRPLR